MKKIAFISVSKTVAANNGSSSKLILLLLLLPLLLLTTGLHAGEIMNSTSGGGNRLSAPSGGNHVLAGCTPSPTKTEMDINNVSCLIFINGDMWWDLVGTATYEVPKGSGKHSLFCGALWIGGLDHASGQLRTACQLYRQSGVDFWPPIDTATVSVTPDVCTKFDKHFKLLRTDVLDFIANNGQPGYTPPDVITSWPGNGDDPVYGAGVGYAHFLAPYYDVDGNGEYDPAGGDFPGYYISPTVTPNTNPCSNDILLGDQTLWWVFNDVGNIHTETHSIAPIGIEIHAEAFAFATNDELNNCTFYRYKIINRSANQLDTTYFAQFVDPDLGYYLDDYVGCDVKRGFGYCYNGEDVDPGATGYGANPPAIGIDFFQGPFADIGDHKDNDRDSCVDCTWYVNGCGVRVLIPDSEYYIDPCNGDSVNGREQIIMSKFEWFNNDATPEGNPTVAADYYNYMRGIWRDGVPMTWGHQGHNTSQNDTCDFMYPTNPYNNLSSDPYGWGNQYATSKGDIGKVWDERSAMNLPYDRRFIQSAGHFTLMPGAVNYITTGAVWARTSSGGAVASIPLILSGDDYAQALFNNCFRVVNGPDAPDVSIRELDKEIIMSLTNDNPLGDNYHENYTEKDPNTTPSSIYKFEGYQIWQVANADVSTTDISNPQFNYGPDPSSARLVATYDIKDGITQIVNYYYDPTTSLWNGYTLVNGTDNGLRHTLVINTDLFATGDPTLINHLTYYFMVLAYAYNPSENPPAAGPSQSTSLNKPYLTGRQNIFVYTAIPHISAPEEGGLVLNSSYGDGPEITRIEGQGNGHQAGSDQLTTDLKQDAAYNELFSAPFQIGTPTYQRARGPVDIRVYDPVAVSGGNFDLKELVNTVPDDTVDAHDTIYYDNVLSSFISSTTTSTVAKDSIRIETIMTITPDTIISGTDTITTMDTLYTYITDTVSVTYTIDTVKTANYVVSDNKWILKNLTTGAPQDTSVKSLFTPYDQLFPAYGFSVNMAQTSQPGVDVAGNAGFIEATQSFDNPLNPWSSGVADQDNTNYDWIASNNTNYIYNDTIGGVVNDKGKIWQSLLGGTWAPYAFTCQNSGASPNAPAFKLPGTYPNIGIPDSNMASVDIFITDDKSKWSRAAVIEEDPSQKGVGHQSFGLLRKSTSLDINYNPIAGSTGFSWFPGYAVNVETGERLDIAFGEDSYLTTANGFIGETGADMIWDPTSTFTGLNANDTTGTQYDILGGKHVIYVFGHTPTFPSYDSCNYLSQQLNAGTFPQRAVWNNCIWVGYAIVAPGEQLDLSNHVMVRIRVTKPYQSYLPAGDTSSSSLPHYQFNTNALMPTINNLATAKSALDLINIVPNPYYAYSQYEINALDYRVRITNLPATCTINIYTPSGTLVRQITRAVGPNNTAGTTSDNLNIETSVDWDLKNNQEIPISSGIYIIHVSAPGIGEKTIKFFGVLRPIDLDTF